MISRSSYRPVRLSALLVSIATVTAGSMVFGDQNWDGDNGVGNLSYDNNWYGNSQPGWGFGNGSLRFNYNNGGQTSIFYDYGFWQDTNDIFLQGTYPSSITFNGNGNGLNFNQRIENNASNKTFTFGSVNLSGAKNGASQIELNPVNGDIVLNGNLYNDNSKPYRVYGNNGKTLTVNTSLGVNASPSSVSFAIEQNSNVIFNNSQVFTGGTTINAGTLTLGHATNSLADSGAINVNGGTLAIGANSDTVGAVTLTSGSITGSGGTLTGSSYDVRSGSISAKLGGNGALTKSTAGTVTLSGANTYSGTTTVQQGTLSLATTGSISSSSSIDVQSGATLDVSAVGAFTVGSGKTLKGNGTVKGNPTVAGNLTPGASAGLLTVDGSLTLSSATLNYEIEGAGTVRGAHASNGYDAVDVVTTSGGTGALTYDGTLNLDFEAGAPSAGSSYDFFNFASASGSFDDINVLFGGVDQNVTWAQNLGIWTSTLGSVVYTFTGSNGVLSLSASAVPEPLTAAGVILLAGRVLGRRNRASL